MQPKGMTSLFLWNMSDKAIDISYGFSVNDGDGKQVATGRSAAPRNFSSAGGLGIHDFALRSELMSALVDGTLVIDVRMKVSIPPKSVPAPYIPQNPVAKMIQGIFLDEKYSDIVFEVGGGDGKDNAMKVAKTTPVAFPAHRCIVENCSSIFAALCVLGEGGNEKIPIQINDVKPDMFRLLLNYMYGGRLSDDDMKSHAREIIDAADKYGVVNLKLEAEICFVEGTTFTIENVVEHLSYAESKNCALLKEAAMDFIVDNKSEVIKNMSFADVPGTLARDILVATSRRDVRGPVNTIIVHFDRQYNKYVRAPIGLFDRQCDTMRISELRKRAHEKGLPVDGSREMLIASLEAVQEVESEEKPEEGSEGSDEGSGESDEDV